MQREVVAANVAPGVTPPFLKHIPEFRRNVRNYVVRSMGMGNSGAYRDADKSVADNPEKINYQFEVQPGVACVGCFEP